MMRKKATLSLTAAPRELTEADATAIVEMALKRAALVGDLKQALQEGDTERALKTARLVCGLEVMKQ